MKPEDCKTDKERDIFVSVKSKEFDAVISFAQTALKIPILINGGAAIAMLALIGNTWGENSLTADLAKSLLFFSIGVFMAAIGTGVTYLAQCRFHQDNEDIMAHVCRYLAIACIVISYTLFMLGACWAYSTFSTLKPT